MKGIKNYELKGNFMNIVFLSKNNKRERGDVSK